MADPTETKRLLGLVQYYEGVLRDMQEGVFFAQDPEGVLRRWRPLPPITADGQHIES